MSNTSVKSSEDGSLGLITLLVVGVLGYVLSRNPQVRGWLHTYRLIDDQGFTPLGVNVLIATLFFLISLAAGIIYLVQAAVGDLRGWQHRNIPHHQWGPIILACVVGCGIWLLVLCLAIINKVGTGWAAATVLAGLSSGFILYWVVVPYSKRAWMKRLLNRTLWQFVATQNRQWRIVGVPQWVSSVRDIRRGATPLPHTITVRVGPAFRLRQGALNTLNEYCDTLVQATYQWTHDPHHYRLTGLIEESTPITDEETIPSPNIGAYMGVKTRRLPRRVEVRAHERGVAFVFGPPGSMKTQGIIMPSVAVAPAACVSTSVKTEVLENTAPARAQKGTIWLFDPAGINMHSLTDMVHMACWSPLAEVHSWGDALQMANQMTLAARPSTATMEGGDHFIQRAESWLALLLYTCGVLDKPLSTFTRYCLNPIGSLDEIGNLLDLTPAEHATIPKAILSSLITTPERERGSIASALANLTKVYAHPLAVELGSTVNFNVDEFVRSTDTLYIAVPVEKQDEYAPLVGGLLETIRHAQYRKYALEEAHSLPHSLPLTFVLDEAANTAALPLPQIVSEGGGQGLHIVAALQSFAQAKERWPHGADGFLTMATDLMILGGIREPALLQALSTAAGSTRTAGLSTSATNMAGAGAGMGRILGEMGGLGAAGAGVSRGNSFATIQESRLSEGDLAAIPTGEGILYTRGNWQPITLNPYYQWH